MASKGRVCLATLTGDGRRVDFDLEDCVAVLARLDSVGRAAALEDPWRLRKLGIGVTAEVGSVAKSRGPALRLTLDGEDLASLFQQFRTARHTFPLGATVYTPTGAGRVVAYVGSGQEQDTPLLGAEGSPPMHVVLVGAVRRDYWGDRLRPEAADVFAAQPTRLLRELWKDTLRIHDQAPIPKQKAALVQGLGDHFTLYRLDPWEALLSAIECGGEPISLSGVRRAETED